MVRLSGSTSRARATHSRARSRLAQRRQRARGAGRGLAVAVVLRHRRLGPRQAHPRRPRPARRIAERGVAAEQHHRREVGRLHQRRRPLVVERRRVQPPLPEEDVAGARLGLERVRVERAAPPRSRPPPRRAGRRRLRNRALTACASARSASSASARSAAASPASPASPCRKCSAALGHRQLRPGVRVGRDRCRWRAGKGARSPRARGMAVVAARPSAGGPSGRGRRRRRWPCRAARWPSSPPAAASAAAPRRSPARSRPAARRCR